MTQERAVMKFTDPPTPRRTRRDWEPVIRKLRRKPGEWMLVYEGCKVSVVQAIRQGSVSPLHPDKGFEVQQTNTTQGPDGRRADLYLRYVPSADKGKS